MLFFPGNISGKNPNSVEKYPITSTKNGPINVKIITISG